MSTREFFRFSDCTCGHFDLRSWPVSPAPARCPRCGAPRKIEVFVERYVAHVPYTARKRFSPHFNTSLGMEIESPEHFDAMKRRFGVMDADLKPGSSCDGGVPASVPRDWFDQSKKASAAIERIEADAGVRSEVDADEREFAADPITEVPIGPIAGAA